MKINKIRPSAHPYTFPLEHIALVPKQLFYRGEIPGSRIPSVAIVGTRKPSRYGNEIAHQMAYELAKRGIVIISGLALGVDSIAHRAALEAGGTTIAVLANSVDTIYPRSHDSLALHIIDHGGAIISEYEPPTGAMKHHFLARNRIVSGLADTLIIIEAAERSGTLSTAAHALEQGKDIFAVPGNITSPLSAGCNTLIKQGATPLLSYTDVLERIAPEKINEVQLPLGDTPLEHAIIQLLASGVRDGDELFEKCSTSIAEFHQAITMLELKNAVRSLGANQWSLA